MTIVSMTEKEIKKWANTSVARRTGEFLVVQHYADKLYYYFSPAGETGWQHKMSSVVFHSMEQNG